MGRVIAPLGRCLTPAAAREVLSLHADEAATLRIEELAAKCDAGTLTPEERAEYQVIVEVGDSCSAPSDQSLPSGSPCAHDDYFMTTASLQWFPARRRVRVSYSSTCTARYVEIAL